MIGLSFLKTLFQLIIVFIAGIGTIVAIVWVVNNMVQWGANQIGIEVGDFSEWLLTKIETALKKLRKKKKEDAEEASK